MFDSNSSSVCEYWSYKVAKIRCDFRQRLHRIAEEKHAKTRVGIADDGISYLGITKYLQSSLVFKDEALAEDFETAVEKIPLEYRKRKRMELSEGSTIAPDVEVRIQPIQRSNGRSICCHDRRYRTIL